MTEHRLFVHDMKNLLGIIIGYSALLLDEIKGDDSRRPDLDEIRKAGEGALALLEDWNKTVRGDARK
jgi:signal transduction histidine kinase